MKKILIILGVLIGINIIIITANKVFAYDYNAQDKKAFYDNYISGMFISLQQSLLSQGFTKSSVAMYTATMKSRFNTKRTKFENATWGCVSQYTPEQIIAGTNTINDKCFRSYIDPFFFEQNTDAIKLLRK